MTEGDHDGDSVPINNKVVGVGSSTSSIRCIAQSSDIVHNGNDNTNFLQGCKFSPDGLCVLTYSVYDAKLRLYNTPPPLTTTATAHHEDNDDDDDSAASATATAERPKIVNSEKSSCWKTALSCDGGDTVRSYTWYPQMDSSNPASCCFLAASRDQPLHLYDAYTGVVRATYCPYNGLDEMESPSVFEFCDQGQKIVTGGFRSDRFLHVFDTNRPGGRESSTILRLGKTRRSHDGQKGLVSALAVHNTTTDNNNNDWWAVGTYAPGSIYLYDGRVAGHVPTGTVMHDGFCVVGHGRSHSRKKKRRLLVATVQKNEGEGNDNEQEESNWFSAAKTKWFQSRARGGVTQLQFAPLQPYLLYSLSRRSNAVIAWDLRMLSDHADYQSHPIGGLASYETNNDTNQRIEFDVDAETGQTMYVGGLDGSVRMYDVASGKSIGRIPIDDNVVTNGISHTNLQGRSLLAVATGSRTFPSEEELDLLSEDEPKQSPALSHGSLRLFELTHEGPKNEG